MRPAAPTTQTLITPAPAPRARKAVVVNADVKGEVAEGHRLVTVFVEPERIWLAGARSQVLRLSSVATEPIDISGFRETTESEATLILGSGNVWMEENAPVKVTVVVELEPLPEPAPTQDEDVEEQNS